MGAATDGFNRMARFRRSGQETGNEVREYWGGREGRAAAIAGITFNVRGLILRQQLSGQSCTFITFPHQVRNKSLPNGNDRLV